MKEHGSMIKRMEKVIYEYSIGKLDCIKGDKYEGDWKEDKIAGNGTL